MKKIMGIDIDKLIHDSDYGCGFYGEADWNEYYNALAKLVGYGYANEEDYRNEN